MSETAAEIVQDFLDAAKAASEIGMPTLAGTPKKLDGLNHFAHVFHAQVVKLATLRAEILELAQQINLSDDNLREFESHLSKIMDSTTQPYERWKAAQKLELFCHGVFLPATKTRSSVQPPMPSATAAEPQPVSRIMDIILSWSKERSREVASALHKWLPTVLPGVKPWMSDKDIAKGKDWFAELHGSLATASSCVICVTKENVRSSWLYYEAGAIAAKGRHVHVCPYLIGIGPSMLKDGPLGKFQCTIANEDDTLRLVSTLNYALPNKHDKTVVEGNFRYRWTELGPTIKAIADKELANADEVIETEADHVAGFKLSSEARTLLLELANDKHGRVLCFLSSDGYSVTTNGRSLCEEGNPRAEAAWRQAVEDLLKYDLVAPCGHKGEVFRITDRGFKVVEVLRGKSP